MAELSGADFSAFAQRTARMQGQLVNVQEDLRTMEATGYGGDGLVCATVTGEGRVVALRIDPEAIASQDPHSLADAVLVAIENARSSADKLRSERLQTVTSSLNDLFEGLSSATVAVPTVKPRTPNRPQ